MEVDELMRRAWEAVEKSGVPDFLQEAAFREAVAALRAQEGASGAASSGGGDRSGGRQSAKKGVATKKSTAKAKDKTAPLVADVPDEDAFFARLADESGVDEQDLRDILQLTRQGEVRVTPPTRRLGSSIVEQARNVVALVGGARANGLAERPVNARALRAELDRKNCYDVNNFSGKHLGPMRGFNAGGRDEIVLTSRWVADFEAAVDQAHGRSAATAEPA